MSEPSRAVAPVQVAAPPGLYAAVYRVLLIGMGISTVLFTAGLIQALRHPGFISLDPNWVRAQYHWSGLPSRLLALDPTALMLTATVVLIFTPVTRVLVAFVTYWRARDYRYVAVTGVVLAVLASTVLLNRLGLL